MRGRHADRGLAVAAMMARSAPRMLAILFLALAARSVQAIWQGARAPETVSAAPVPPADRPPTLTADVGSIVGRHLFGDAVASRADAPPPPTRAALVLGGVWYTPDGDAYALIGEPGAPQKAYRTGSRLPGGVELDAVEADRVLLRRDGKAETLALPRAASVTKPAATARRLP
jgi:type II secretory pathway component PulC